MLFKIRHKRRLARSLIVCGFSKSSQVSKHCLMDACLYVCSWKLINLMVRVIFCSACSYWKKTEKSPGCLVGSQTCSVNTGSLCQHAFLMLCWVCWARNATFSVIAGTSWHSVFSMCPEGPSRAGWVVGCACPDPDCIAWIMGHRISQVVKTCL